MSAIVETPLLSGVPGNLVSITLTNCFEVYDVIDGQSSYYPIVCYINFNHHHDHSSPGA